MSRKFVDCFDVRFRHSPFAKERAGQEDFDSPTGNPSLKIPFVRNGLQAAFEFVNGFIKDKPV